MFKKLFLTVLILGLMVGVGYAGGVTDSNNGNKGNIFVSTGENHGANSVGEWLDASSFKGDKGETGATGSQGVQGIQGLKGEKGNTGATGSQGEQGVTGKDGYTPIKDVDYTDGKDGEQGLQGLQGVAGQVGEQGLQGLTGQQGEVGKEGTEGKQGQRGEKGDKGDTGKGLENRVELIGEVRVFDTRKWAGYVYGGVDIQNNTGITGIKVQYKMGKSYEEKRLDALEKKLNLLETIPEENVTVVPTASGFKIQVN